MKPKPDFNFQSLREAARRGWEQITIPKPLKKIYAPIVKKVKEKRNEEN